MRHIGTFIDLTNSHVVNISDYSGRWASSNIRLKNPTFNVSNIKLLFAIDPLGSPYNDPNNFIAAIGGDQTNYGNGTLNNFLDEIWPLESKTSLIKAPRAAVGGFGSDADAFQSENYKATCGSSCLWAGGIPSVWLAQPAFQKYRTSLNALRESCFMTDILTHSFLTWRGR